MQRWAKILGKKGWLGYGWPKEFGGPGWNAVQKHLFEEETRAGRRAAHRALRPGDGGAGDHGLRQRPSSRSASCPASPAATSGGARATASRARAPTWPRSRPRRAQGRQVHRQRPEDLDHAGPVRRLDLLPGAHRHRRQAADRHLLPADRHEVARRHRAADHAARRRPRGQRGVLRQRRGARREPDRRGEQGLDLRQAPALARAHQHRRRQPRQARARAPQAHRQAAKASGTTTRFRDEIAKLEVDVVALEMLVLRVLSAEKSGKNSLDIAGLLKIKGSEIQQRYTELMMLAARPVRAAASSARRWKPAGRATIVGRPPYLRAAGLDLLQHAQDHDLRRLATKCSATSSPRRCWAEETRQWTSIFPTTRNNCATRCASGSTSGYGFERRRAIDAAGGFSARPRDELAELGLVGLLRSRGRRRHGHGPGRGDGGAGGAGPRHRAGAAGASAGGRRACWPPTAATPSSATGCRASPAARRSWCSPTRSARRATASTRSRPGRRRPATAGTLTGAKSIVPAATRPTPSSCPRKADGKIALFLVERARQRRRRPAATARRTAAAPPKCVFDKRRPPPWSPTTASPRSSTPSTSASPRTCAEAVGVMDKTMQLTVEYLNTRKQFGVTIGTFQALRHRIADMKMQLELARSMSYYAIAQAQRAHRGAAPGDGAGQVPAGRVHALRRPEVGAAAWRHRRDRRIHRQPLLQAS